MGVGAFMALGGGSLLVQQLLRRRGLVRVRATVVGHKRFEDSEGDTYATEFEYSVGARLIRVTDEMHYGWKVFDVGQAVELAHHPNEPDAAFVPRWWPIALSAAVSVTGAGAAYWVAVNR